MQEVIDIIKLQKCTSFYPKFVQVLCLKVSLWIIVPVQYLKVSLLILVPVPENQPMDFSSCNWKWAYVFQFLNLKKSLFVLVPVPESESMAFTCSSCARNW
jgi:hypothetical protein